MKTREEYLTDIRSFKNLNAEKFGIQAIGIFGSVARNEHHADSDLDVFVDLKNPEPFVMVDIQEALERVCGCKVDLVRLRKSLRSLLLKRIEKDGIYA
jgi:predicted nucleotidyltransferase